MKNILLMVFSNRLFDDIFTSGLWEIEGRRMAVKVVVVENERLGEEEDLVG